MNTIPMPNGRFPGRFMILTSPMTLAHIEKISADTIAHVNKQIEVVEKASSSVIVLGDNVKRPLGQVKMWLKNATERFAAEGGFDTIRALMMPVMRDLNTPKRSQWFDSNANCTETGKQVDQLLVDCGTVLQKPYTVIFTPYAGRDLPDYVTMFFDLPLSPDREVHLLSAWYPDFMGAPFKWDQVFKHVAEDGQNRTNLSELLKHSLSKWELK